MDTLTDKDLSRIDDEIFLCDRCGWWKDKDEESERLIQNCNECISDEEE